ncbi:PASTA domain-containing protein [Cellulosimicrobium sp. CUA-896]|uniref:PASTA domain-containing protein n=1 Tax=Cellulosimicrobium sp. CUA-896 TaxID=1517881 RepID=UPI002100C0A9|nr:PASTA domain-containing protein [Cellulosimicrobium sp. CUA-896]
MSQQDARAALQALGLKANVTEEFSDTVPRGIVISSGSAGAQVPPGSTIALVVSKGPDPANQEPEEPEEPEDPENPEDPDPGQSPPPTTQPTTPGGTNQGGNNNRGGGSGG